MKSAPLAAGIYKADVALEYFKNTRTVHASNVLGFAGRHG